MAIQYLGNLEIKGGKMNEDVKNLLDTVKVGAMATVKSDGTPLATPLHFARTGNSIVWISSPESRHAVNALRTGRLEFVVWNEQRQAFYLNTTAVLAAGEEREKALTDYKKKLGDFLPKLDELGVYISPVGELDENSTTQNMWHFVA